MLEQSDFIRILLLLTTALGLSFTIERGLELLNGLLKKLLQSELSPFTDDALQAPDLVDAEIAAIDAVLTREAEAIAGLRVVLRDAGETRAQIEADLENRVAAFDAQIAGWRDRLRAIRGDKDAPLTDRHEERLAALERRLDVYFVGNQLPAGLEMEENYPEAQFVLEPIPPRRPIETAQEFWLQVLGAFAGVTLCYFSDFGLFSGIGVFGAIDPLADAVLSGILIGGGSQPIHVLMKFLNERSVVDLKPVRPEDLVATPAALAGPPLDAPRRPNTSTSIDIPYEGGVDRDTLDPGRRRAAPPDLIVYHHTAMHSDTTFEDVVRVIKGRGWSTGYHAVVTYDGEIHAFCRWDYVGNHAAGVNERSLGIALNGNFHTLAGDSGSNDRGQYGHACPSDDQLFNAARVVALWCHLYDIPVDFGRTIVAHRQVRATACAGSNFPDKIFEQLVRSFHAEWSTDAARAELDRYRKKQFLYPV